MFFLSSCSDSTDGLSIAGPFTVEVDETAQLTATYSQGGSSLVVTDSAFWSSADEELATVGNAGLVTGLLEGTVAISVLYNDFDAEHRITVVDTTIGTMVITPDPVTVPVAGTVQLTATHSEDGEVSALAFWESSNLGVATVGSDTGLVTGGGVGTADITATYGGITATVPLTVFAPTTTAAFAEQRTAGLHNRAPLGRGAPPPAAGG